MGLDLVEMVMELEDEFGLTIADEETEQLGTVGELYRYLLTREGVSLAGACWTQRVFYRVRKLLVHGFLQSRQQVTPSAALLPLLGNDHLEASWSRFGRCLELELPPLGTSWLRPSPALPHSCQTVGGVTRAALSLNLGRLLGPNDPRVAVWERMSKVLQQTLGLPRHTILCQNHFVHDLGCG